MSKVVKIMKNKLMIAAMVAVMVFGTAMVPVHATTITTNDIYASSGHTYYIRKNDGKTELGYMYVKRTTSGEVSNTYTAAISCKKAVVSVKGSTSEAYTSKSVNNLSAGAAVWVKKTKSGYKQAYGKGSITY